MGHRPSVPAGNAAPAAAGLRPVGGRHPGFQFLPALAPVFFCSTPAVVRPPDSNRRCLPISAGLFPRALPRASPSRRLYASQSHAKRPDGPRATRTPLKAPTAG
jgi:hypothetical protein